MNKRPLLLDLFCGAGGAAVGYHRAGFNIVGVDIKRQPRYPFPLIIDDALGVLRQLNAGWSIGPSTPDGKRYWRGDFDFIHASPPCQAYSRTQAIHGRKYPDLLPAVRRALIASGRPWVIENVAEAPMVCAVVLCGGMFGLKVYRHRRFESSTLLFSPEHPPHRKRAVAVGRKATDSDFMTVAGHFNGIALASAAMGIDWMIRDELSQAIPPAYCEFIGRQLMNAIGASGDAHGDFSL